MGTIDQTKSMEVRNGVILEEGCAGIFSGAGDPSGSAPEGSRYLNSNGTEWVYVGGTWVLVPDANFIPQYNSDPVSPATNSSWVRRNVGNPIGLLLTLTRDSYDFRYKTTEGAVVGTVLR